MKWSGDSSRNLGEYREPNESYSGISFSHIVCLSDSVAPNLNYPGKSRPWELLTPSSRPRSEKKTPSTLFFWVKNGWYHSWYFGELSVVYATKRAGAHVVVSPIRLCLTRVTGLPAEYSLGPKWFLEATFMRYSDILIFSILHVHFLYISNCFPTSCFVQFYGFCIILP